MKDKDASRVLEAEDRDDVRGLDRCSGGVDRRCSSMGNVRRHGLNEIIKNRP